VTEGSGHWYEKSVGIGRLPKKCVMSESQAIQGQFFQNSFRIIFPNPWKDDTRYGTGVIRRRNTFQNSFPTRWQQNPS